ncbi:MAG: hypothetical protein GX552_01005 [Chloroflexi bacterium]|jgi:membrane protein implicated in regulation of membrane protease activity|nr:hypothetical protein [Chloroflexota bacterium]
MLSWWTRLSSLNQGFFVAAIFFSTIFLWQFVSSFTALAGDAIGGDGDAGDASMDGDGDLADADLDGDDVGAAEQDAGLATFRLLSIRSLLAFGTLFSWAGALYLQNTPFATLALVRALLWGLAGMVVVAFFFWALPRLTEEGTARLDTAIGQNAQVYLDIPEDGVGQVKVLVGGMVSFVKARASNGQRLSAGTVVRVVGTLDNSVLVVEPIEF